MKVTCVLALFLLCSSPNIFFCPLVCADATGDARAAIEPQYVAMDAASMAGDASVYA